MSRKIEEVKNKIEEYMIEINKYSSEIISKYTDTLDSIMRDIKNDVIDSDNVDDALLQHYFLSLTNALYFIGSSVESVGFYDDISELNYKLAYNEAFIENKAKSVGNAVKQTNADNQIAAENNSVSEQVMNLVYSRSYKIIKAKIDAGYEMVRTLSKILSSRQQEKQLTMINKF